MKENDNYNYDNGLFFLAHVIGWIIKIVFKILFFPIRVLFYKINPLKKQRVSIEK